MNRKFLGISIDDWIAGVVIAIAVYGIWWGVFRPL